MTVDNNGRSIASVLRDIVRNVQDIVRSELRLAKTEIGQELVKAKAAAIVLATAAVFAFLALFFALFAGVFALSVVIPSWAAALTVAAATGALAGVLVFIGRGRLKHVHPMPDQTIETIKENFQWKPHAK